MNYKLEKTENSQFYRGNELPGANVGSPERMEGEMPTQSYSAGNPKQPAIEGMTKEREEELDVLMNGIKEFIRNIDISRL